MVVVLGGFVSIIVWITVSSGASVGSGPPSTGTTEYVARTTRALSGNKFRGKNGSAVLKWTKDERARRAEVEMLRSMMVTPAVRNNNE